MSAYLGIQVARLLVQGDVHGARLLAGGRRVWRACEARAISGACRVAQARYGASVSLEEFL